MLIVLSAPRTLLIHASCRKLWHHEVFLYCQPCFTACSI